MNDTLLREEIRAERERLADLLTGLDESSWDHPSLCSGWRVREVVAHVTMPFRLKPARFFLGLARAGFSFNRFADRAARTDTARLSSGELLASLRANLDTEWKPPGGGLAGALSHDTIHGLDITEPLGLPAAPPERIALVLANSSPRSLKYFGTDLTGLQLRAVDADIRLGQGRPVDLTARELLLAVTGRRPLPQ